LPGLGLYACDGTVGFFRGQAVFGLKVIRSLNWNWTQRHNLGAHNDSDFLTTNSPSEPMTKFRACRSDSDGLHVSKKTLMGRTVKPCQSFGQSE